MTQPHRPLRPAIALGLFAIAVASVLGLAPAGAAAASLTSEFTIVVTSQTPLATGIVLTEGAPAELQISGNAKCGAGSDCPEGSFDGSGQTCEGRELGPLEPGPAGPDIPYGAAVVRVGSGPWTVIAPGEKITGQGEVQLLYSDCTGYYGDNTGSFQVSITYTPQALVSGQILDQGYKAVTGVTVMLSGTTETAEPVSLSTTTDSSGKYSFAPPAGTYSVTASGDPEKQNGGTLAVMTATNGDASCSGTAKEATCSLKPLAVGEQGSANFIYTMCSASARTPNGKQPTGCPIIFIPGILGSVIACGGRELFPNIPATHFAEMELESDGETKAGAAGSCEKEADVPAGEAGLVTSAGGIDAYGGFYSYLKRIATNGAYVYPFDWRRGVDVAAKGLTALVQEALKQTNAKHVVLVAHSMGGLVLQQYVIEHASEETVSRAVTIGTPYWGAPKSIIALMDGHSNEFSLEAADYIFGVNDVQKAAENYTGLFWLYPSAAYGPWLEIYGKGYPVRELGGSEIDPWVSSLGGTAALLDRAEAGHATLDGFKPEGVDYEIVAGTELPTITNMEIKVNEFEPLQFVSAKYASGDGTVPARSQTQGAFPSGSAPVKIHYACGIGHSKEPGNTGIQSRIEEFLLSGEEIKGPEEDCRYGGDETIIYQTNIAGHGSAASVATASGSVLTLEQARNEGVIQLLELGSETIVVTNEREPVTLKIAGENIALRVRPIENNSGGKPSYYGPVSGTFTLDGSVVAKGSKKLHPRSAGHAPRTIARVRRAGRLFRVRLSASGAVRVRAIRYRIGKAPPKTYGHALLLTRAQLKKLRFSSVDVFGAWGRTGHASIPR